MHFDGIPMPGATPVSPLEELQKARAQIDAGNPADAASILLSLVDTVQDTNVTPQALMLYANLMRAQNNTQEQLALLKRAVEEYPTSPHHPQAAIAYAEALELAGQPEEAKKYFERITESAPPALRAAALFGLGKQEEKKGASIAARDFYRKALEDAKWDSEVWNRALDAFGELNVALLFSPGETPESKHYAIESGDTLTKIGIKLNTTQGLLVRANQIDDPSRLHLGQRLKYTPKDFRILIERSTCRLFLLDNNGLFKRYYTGLGMPGHETTLGSYTIGNKQKDPVWWKPGGEAVPPGDPNNELGTRWMPLVPTEEGLPTDLGIHGTIAPETIGQYKSHGCPRMRKKDVEELYDLVVRSTPVEIVEKFTWEPENEAL